MVSVPPFRKLTAETTIVFFSPLIYLIANLLNKSIHRCMTFSSEKAFE